MFIFVKQAVPQKLHFFLFAYFTQPSRSQGNVEEQTKTCSF